MLSNEKWNQNIYIGWLNYMSIQFVSWGQTIELDHGPIQATTIGWSGGWERNAKVWSRLH